jgi:ribA/ribD-fused uncharacterized protein
MANQGPIFFFHEERENGYFSQWYPAPFHTTVDGQKILYQNAEQYMMHHKALLGAPHPDTKTIKEILLTPCPRACKALGTRVQNFSPDRWDKHKFNVVAEGSYLKFTSSEELKELLLETGERELMEASHFDRCGVWDSRRSGVGWGKRVVRGERTGG